MHQSVENKHVFNTLPCTITTCYDYMTNVVEVSVHIESIGKSCT